VGLYRDRLSALETRTLHVEACILGGLGTMRKHGELERAAAATTRPKQRVPFSLPTRMKRARAPSEERRPSKRPKACNFEDPVTQERLDDIAAADIEVIEDAAGRWSFRKDSLEAIRAHAARERAAPLNPYSGLPLPPTRQEIEGCGGLREFTDPLQERAYPTVRRTEHLIVDVCIRLQRHGIFVTPALLCEQRIGRLRRLFTAVHDVFLFNFEQPERLALAPPHGRLSTFEPAWASWAVWRQATMLALARCAGERSDAPVLLRKRGAEMCLVALSRVVPEVARELAGRVEVVPAAERP